MSDWLKRAFDVGDTNLTTEQVQLFDDMRDRIEELTQWVNDLQKGMYINCVYCGHRYGPDDEIPATMADILKRHIEKCPIHPLSHVRAHLKLAENAMRNALNFIGPLNAGRGYLEAAFKHLREE